ncbi:TetR/AcrR family transcriptional regulator [Paracoccus sp. T5]|uniref:TetR/AcrR family transcriptional regulator n=1 Tax=Paracoccus sp. T5 TaxID=3402161 RepID=UPI003AD83F56
MTINLRDRRRRQTARDIQQAALRVALQAGYCAATTDAIAAEAGISPRTFFNYYPNKTAAVLGQPPILDTQAGAWITTSEAPLVDDLVRLLGQMLKEDSPDRQTLRMIERLIETTPEMQMLFRKSLDEISLALSGLLLVRLGAHRALEAELIAAMSTHALANGVRSWAADESMDLDGVLEMTRDQLRSVCVLLN